MSIDKDKFDQEAEVEGAAVRRQGELGNLASKGGRRPRVKGASGRDRAAAEAAFRRLVRPDRVNVLELPKAKRKEQKHARNNRPG